MIAATLVTTAAALVSGRGFVIAIDTGRRALARLLVVAALAQGVAAASEPVAPNARSGDAPIAEKGFITLFGAHTPFEHGRWWVTHDRANGNPRHNICWRADAVTTRAEGMRLDILPGPCMGRDFAAGSVKTHMRHGFGRFDVVMRPDFAPGAVSAFFTYTGPAFRTRHDEIDIEFTGRSPTEMQINTFVAKKGLDLPPVDLGFRYDERPRAYGFDWTPEHVAWRFDGREVARVEGEGVPSVPGKITTSVWAAKNLKRWAGEFDAATALPYGQEVHCVSWRPVGDDGPSCTDLYFAGAIPGVEPASAAPEAEPVR